MGILYVYECEKCGAIGEFITRMNEYQNCPDCGAVMKRLPTPFNINMGAAGAHGYYDDNLEKYIHTNKQRKEEMRKQGVTEHGATPKIGDSWI